MRNLNCHFRLLNTAATNPDPFAVDMLTKVAEPRELLGSLRFVCRDYEIGYRVHDMQLVTEIRRAARTPTTRVAAPMSSPTNSQPVPSILQRMLASTVGGRYGDELRPD
jgi:hypothetical protein